MSRNSVQHWLCALGQDTNCIKKKIQIILTLIYWLLSQVNLFIKCIERLKVLVIQVHWFVFLLHSSKVLDLILTLIYSVCRISHFCNVPLASFGFLPSHINLPGFTTLNCLIYLNGFIRLYVRWPLTYKALIDDKYF